MNDVAIIGVGLHPFGRFEGKSAMEMGVDAIFAAVADAGVEWRDIQFATGGSWTVANPDAIVGMVGLSGIPFTNVFNACATAASAAKACADGIRLGDYDIGIAVGLDKHPRGAFTEDPALVGMPSWYAENGQYLTTQFFGMKANRYLHDHGISQQTLAKVVNKNLRNGALNPNAFRRKPIAEEDILNSTDAELSTHPVHVLRPRRGRGGGGHVPRRHRAPLHVEARIPARGRGAHPPLRRLRGEHHLRPGRRRMSSPTVYAARAAFEKAGVAPEDVDVIQLQDTDAGAEIIHMAECGFCADGDQEKLLADGATEIGGSLPVNTDGGLIANGEPIGASGLRQIHELVRQLRGEAGDRQVPGEPKVGFAQLYGAPGTAGATILTTLTARSQLMTQFTGAPIFDADQHMYETPDALTKYLPEQYQRAVQFAQIGRQTRIVINNRVTDFIPNPTFERVAAPGAHEKFFAGENTEGLTLREMQGPAIEAPAATRNPEDRIAELDRQGVVEALNYPTLAQPGRALRRRRSRS